MKVVFNVITKLLLVFSLCVKAEIGVTLTTEVDCNDECLKPTKSLRRMMADKSQTKTTKALLKKGVSNIKSIHSDIWKWDYWCQLQPKIGTCSGKRLKYYYNSQLNQCDKFKYSGCGGNKNNFKTLAECERHCKGTTFMELKNIGSHGHCYLQPHSGLCLAMQTMYYYDINKRQCQMFIYGGCGGNGNRFFSSKKCAKECTIRKHMRSDDGSTVGLDFTSIL